MTQPDALDRLALLVGEWTTVAENHRAMPDVVANGTVRIEWLAGERFLLARAENDAPYPSSTSIIGVEEGTPILLPLLRLARRAPGFPDGSARPRVDDLAG